MLLRYLAIAVIGLLMAVPLLFMLSGSLKSAAEVSQFPPSLLPSVPIWQNFADAWEFLTPRVVVNSFIFAFGVILVQLAISIPAAFALAKIPFRWTGLILGVLIIPHFVPGNLSLIPLYVITNELGLLNTYAGMILPIGGQCAFAVLLFRQFFVTLPKGLTDAARLDGAGWFRVLTSITMPLAGPAMATYCSVTFLTAWNMYIWPLLAAPDPAHRVLNVALAPLASGSNVQISPAVALAGAVIAMLPVLLVFVVSQKWYVKGVAGTGID
ncbi:carbohydrate ABC transporter membrane protein 2 (CUT1 family) [Haloactinopolyspora alba]|uniref:Carbohydrate ABC transporter membrane protein 2 (CUT1 family) n=1 Tax=Haloactinopolyspora alba TaxID=648780 RepID=A0A2P8E500_9ACTN|nr:carbohydrate ABC transporter membrane protein 2 (CUT1 family) [Haloactinopolyspora alba]